MSRPRWRDSSSNEVLAQNGRGVKRAAQTTAEFLYRLAARSRTLCASNELLAQNGRGVKRTAQTTAEFLYGLAARSRALCALQLNDSN